MQPHTPLMTLRPATWEDGAALADIYAQAVRNIDPSIYSEAEKSLWLRDVDTAVFWMRRIPQTRPLVAECHGEAAGFIEYLPEKAHIDCLYVHPKYQRQGVAGMLLAYVQQLAILNKQPCLTVEAAKTAVPFFRRHGFILQGENRVARHGATLINYRMLWQRPEKS